MTTYTNPTGSQSGTTGNDTVICNVTPAQPFGFNGLDGTDTLIFSAPFAFGVTYVVRAYSGNQLDGEIGPDGSRSNFIHFENVTITGTQFNDGFQLSGEGNYSAGGLSIDGGAGVDQLNIDFSDFNRSNIGVSFVVAADGSITNSFGRITNIEKFNFTGGTGADTFVAGAGDDYLSGGAGADYIDGGAGNDIIIGGPITGLDSDADVLIGGDGNDRIIASYGDSVDGGSGYDLIRYDASEAAQGIYADFSQVTHGGSISIGNGTIKGIEEIFGVVGTSFDDTIIVGASSGQIQIEGRGGNDHIVGSTAYETIIAGDGDDVITGGLGGDDLRGGAGADTFIDTLTGFNGDVIDELGIGDKIIITDANPNSFTYSVSGNVLTYSGGSLRIGAALAGHVVASAAAGGGVQLELKLPPVGTFDQIASQLTNGFWNANGLSTRHFNVAQGGTITVNIIGLTSDGQTLARAALGAWTDIIGVHFSEVGSGGQIVFDDNQSGAFEDDTVSGGSITTAHVNVSTAWLNAYGSSLNSYSYQTYIHEIGHALGLGHAGNYNETATYGQDAIFLNDAWSTSIMSYFNPGENIYYAQEHFSILNALSPMEADIVAMQSLYGLSTTTRTGDTIYGFHSNAGGIYDIQNFPNVAYTIYDSGGNDTLDFSWTSGGQLINLNPETFSNVNGYTGNLMIARGVVIENAVGGEGRDVIIGNSADNVIRGNLGNDALTGGGGNDTFRDTAGGLNGDTISDFSAGDRIVITDANVAGFTFNLAGQTLNYTGGSITLSNLPAGTFVAHAAVGGGVEMVLAPHDVTNDFNRDGRSDVLWRSDTGELTSWLASSSGGFSANGGNAYTIVPTSWNIAGTGDFDGDGRHDILWRNDSGAITNWIANASGNGGFAASTTFSNTVSNTWHVVGVGDFNADGRDDILWRSDDGTITDWLSNANGTFSASTTFSTNVPTDWHVTGTGDFNGDGFDDILWRNDSGQLTDWLRTPSGSFISNVFSVYVPTGWSVAATGDFNGDGYGDILWRQNGGQLTDWLGSSTGALVDNGANASIFVPANWQVVSVGDFNGDARDDILWRNDGGQLTEWLGSASGGFTDNSANAATYVPTSWHVQDAHVHGLFA